MISGSACCMYVLFFSSRRRHTRLQGDWSSDVCSSDLAVSHGGRGVEAEEGPHLGLVLELLDVVAVDPAHRLPVDVSDLGRKRGVLGNSAVRGKRERKEQRKRVVRQTALGVRGETCSEH